MPELELLPEKTKKIELKTGKVFPRSILFLIIVFGLYGGLFFYNQRLENKLEESDTAFLAVSQKRDKAKEQRVFDVRDKLNQAQLLLDEQPRWSTAFEKLQSLILPSVRFESITASLPEAKFEFKATAPNLSTIARQGANFLADDSVADVSVNQIKILNTGEAEFIVKLTFNKDKFLK